MAASPKLIVCIASTILLIEGITLITATPNKPKIGVRLIKLALSKKDLNIRNKTKINTHKNSNQSLGSLFKNVSYPSILITFLLKILNAFKKNYSLL